MGRSKSSSGARSAIFADPATRPVVIDEEHESSFKQESVPRYHARDVAVVRAKYADSSDFGLCDPALETWQNAVTNRFTLLTLSERVGNRPMPDVELVDLTAEKWGTVLSNPLREAMISALDANGQVILLLNRRGFHTFALCTSPTCGKTLKCKRLRHQPDVAQGSATVGLSYLRSGADETARVPLLSGSAGVLRWDRYRRLERVVREVFPDRSVRRMDSDTMRGQGSHERNVDGLS